MQKRTFIFTTLATLTLSIAAAQSRGEVTLKIIDSKSEEAMVGTVVSLAEQGDTPNYKSTNGSGLVSFPSMEYGEYRLEATFMGYDTLRRNIVVNSERLDLGSLKMDFQSRVLDRVTVETNSIRTSQSGDTVIYNADSFKVSADAAAEGLLAKMPGITVNNGEIEAQGESVQKILLDGKEFFGEDVTIAMKSIPADIIANVEVYNKLSDNAEFSGFDDGDSYKAINIVTKSGMNRGQFGKFILGYASDNLYQASANYNYFSGNHRISILASANNMNIKGFGTMDLGGGGRKGGGRAMGSGAGSFSDNSPSDGLSTLAGFGLNYGGELLDSKLKINASYFYNMSDNEVDKLTDREYIIDEEELKRYYDAISRNEAENMNHRFNAMVEYKPNERNALMMRPEFAFQNNDSSTYSLANNDESPDGETMYDLNEIENITLNDKDAFSISNMLVYRVLLGVKGRNIVFTARGSYSRNDNYGLTSNTTFTPTSRVESEILEQITKQNILNDTEGYSINSSATYSEPIFDKRAMLTMKYAVNYNYSDADYLVYEWEQEQNIFNPDYDPTSSNIYNSGYLTQNVGPGVMYSKKNNIQLNANVSYQNSTLANMQEMPVITPSEQDYTFQNVVYSMMMRKTFNKTNTLRMMLRSSTKNPSVGELQDVVKDSNPQFVTSGNSALQPSYNNMLRAIYVRSSENKGRTFMAMISGNYATNAISDETVMLLTPEDSYTIPINGEELAQFGEYTRPVNMDGDWNVSTNISYGTPFNLLYSNVNLDLGVNYSETPSILNGSVNLNRTTNYKGGVSLGSNISERVDFTLSYKGGYNVANYENDIEGMKNQDNKYLTNLASAQFKFVLWGGITLSGDGAYSQYKGITDDFNEEYLLCNVALGKKIFKSQRGEITIGVNDIFDQTENFARNITESYIENVTSNAIGRYYGFKFTFDLRKFKGSATMPTPPQGPPHHRGMMMMY